MVKIGAVLNVVPPSETTTTTTTTLTTTSTSTTTTAALVDEFETGSQLSSSHQNKSEKLVGIEVTTSATTERRPKVVSDVFTEPDIEDDVPESGAKQFNAYDYGDKKLGRKLVLYFLRYKYGKVFEAKLLLKLIRTNKKHFGNQKDFPRYYRFHSLFAGVRFQIS